MVELQATMKNGVDRTLYIAEDRKDFNGWNFIGVLDIEDKPRSVMGVIHRMNGSSSEVRSVIIDVSLWMELMVFGIIGVEMVG